MTATIPRAFRLSSEFLLATVMGAGAAGAALDAPSVLGRSIPGSGT